MTSKRSVTPQTTTTTSPELSKSSSKKGDKPDLFNNVYYYINDSIQSNVKLQLISLLSSRQAINLATTSTSTSTSNSRFDLSKITHFITDSLDFPEFHLLRPGATKGTSNERERSLDGHVKGREPSTPTIEIVTPVWVTRSFDLQIIQQPRYYSADRSLYFSGLCFCTSELPQTDSIAIQAGVLSLGGQWRKELTREVTHLFCVAPGGKKYDAAIKYGPELGMVVVLPHWFEECVKLHQPIPLDAYLFPSPPLLSLSLYLPTNLNKSFDERMSDFYKSRPKLPSSSQKPSQQLSSTQRILGIAPGGNLFFPQGGISTTTSTSDNSSKESESYQKTSTCLLDPSDTLTAPIFPPTLTLATSNLPIFSERKVYLAGDLGIRPGLELAIKKRVEDAGGVCWSWGVDGNKNVDHGERRREAERMLKDANLVVCRHREGWEFWQAFDQKKTIGNLAWMYHVLQSNRLSSPLDRVLHFPLPPGTIKQFQATSITISNYSGPARDYVRTLIETVGAKFEGAMSKTTNFVVSASEFGAKVKHAKQWQIPLVTHLWLEQCIISWSLVPPVASPTYLCANTSTGVNFASILGLTPFPRSSLERWANKPEVEFARAEALRECFEDVVMGEEGGEVEMEEMGSNGKGRFLDPEREVDEDVAGGGGGGRDVQMEDVAVNTGGGKGKKAGRAPRDHGKGEGKERQLDSSEDEEEDEEDEVVIVAPDPKPKKAKAPIKPATITIPDKASKSKKVIASRKPSSSPPPVVPPPPPAQKAISNDSPLTSAAEEEEEEEKSDEEEEEKSEDEVDEVVKGKGKGKGKGKQKQVAPSKATASSINKKKPSPPSSSSSSSSRSPSPAVNTPSKRIDFYGEVPVVGKRAAAGLAAKRLAEQMPDANLFAKELRNSVGKKRKRDSFGAGSGMGRGRGGGRTQTQEVESESESEEEEKVVEKKVKGKTVVTAVTTSDSEEEEDEEEEKPAKKVAATGKGVRTLQTAKKSTGPKAKLPKRVAAVQAGVNEDQQLGISSFDNPPHGAPPKKKVDKPKPIRIMTTGLGLDQKSDEMKALAKLGAKWTDSPKDVTHLVVASISRTEKFLSCLAYAPKIVQKSWVTESIAAGKLLDEEPYLLQDKVKERDLGDTLVNILKRARTKPLFKGVTIYITPKCLPDTGTLRRVIQCGGGTVSLANIEDRLATTQITTAEPGKAYIISCVKDRQKWERLVSKHRIPIYSVEAIFQSVMYQQIKFLEEYRVDPRNEQ